MTPQQDILSVRALTVERDGRRTIDRLDLGVGAGCVFALLGGNGAGKTTTLNVLLGFVAPASGEARVAGFSPTRDAAEVRRRLAYLPENVALYPYLSGVENLQYFCTLADIALGRADARALLARTGLQAQAHEARVATYSKGMRQKVGLAIAHAKRAEAMLLDEPTSGLDPGAANDFARRMRAAADGGMAVLMATHDLFNARQVADRIGILKAGRLVAAFDARTVSHGELERAYLAHAHGDATEPAP
ncbi:ABC-2 type transport system ATP-binding protein [Variovorax sp. TBS-050B]|uniref:ABC transporter ATP-binding protein n=1 Tax=Variovorax sp. TBS-050B TaxID=2940551 RepID=UPI0024736657|nr:ABC transporter ATP-binding protein [Variovorax sp. TBS-050B]MDH6590389.1 ABC-2 type transport system ATP-binding protein [Variovorax sp. TBS-050B]